MTGRGSAVSAQGWVLPESPRGVLRIADPQERAWAAGVYLGLWRRVSWCLVAWAVVGTLAVAWLSQWEGQKVPVPWWMFLVPSVICGVAALAGRRDLRAIRASVEPAAS